MSLGLVGVLMLPSVAWAQEDRELQKQIQNPVANLVSLPFQSNWNLHTGPYERTFHNLNIQPVIPFQGKNLMFISRAIIPVNSVPVGPDDSTFGLGDVTYSLFLSPRKPGKIIWGVGPASLLPTASNPEQLGTEKFSLGPTFVLLAQPGPWTLGFLTNNLWSVGGTEDRADVNQLLFQYFVNFNFGKGWTVGTAPSITADWEAPAGETWTIPVGATVSKITRIGSRPVSLGFQFYHNATRPEFAPESKAVFTITLLYPIVKR